MITSLPSQKQRWICQWARPTDLHFAAHNWLNFARPDQCPPLGDWLIWLLLGGRGAGKTRAGAEWIRSKVAAGAGRIALVGPTYADVREVMLGGESGLLHIGMPSERPRYEASRRRVLWPGGAIGQVFTSEAPDGLRGPQFDCAWADEFCAWDKAQDTLSNLRLALRLGTAPQLCVTTTPRPTETLTALMKTNGLILSRSSTHDNAANLAPGFVAAMVEAYGGTRLGRQELDGELLLDYEGALWTRAGLERCFVANVPPLSKIVVAIDPPVTSGPKADRCGIIVAGRAGEGRNAKAYILQDASVQGLSPDGWARRAIEVWGAQDADYLLAEVNQGGEMVRSVIAAIDPDVPLKTVYASRGKVARAEPVAALYEQGRVLHAGVFKELESELCRMGSGAQKGKSPDRADALVWAVTALLLEGRTDPRVRGI